MSLFESVRPVEEHMEDTDQTIIVVQDRRDAYWLLAFSGATERLFYQRIPTDDADNVPSGYVDKVPGVDTGWPLELLWPLGTREDDWGVYERIGAPFTRPEGRES